MESLRTRQTATVATLNVQLDNLQKALLSERQQTESLGRALDDLSEDLSREAYGRRREISLRLAFLSREEGLAESLRRWIRKSKESFERIHSQDTPPSDNETTLQVVANRTLQDAEGLLESLNGQPALSEDSAGSVARVVASQEAVLTLTRELQYETDRRLQAESRLIQEYLDTSSARMEEPHIDPMGSIVHPTSSDDKGPQTIEPGEKPSPQHTPSSEVVTVALEPTSKESENELVEEPPSRSQISPEDVPSHAEPVVHQLEDQAVSPSIIVADESPETESPSLTNASLTQNPLETTETLETSIPNILPISDTPSDLTTLTSPISPQTLEITQQVPEEDPAEPHLGTPVDSAVTDDHLDVITKDPAVVVEATPEQRHPSSDLGATGIAAVDPSQSPPTSPQLLTTPVLSSPIAPHPSLPVEAPSHCPSPTSETETETTNCEEVGTLPPPSSCVRQSDEPGGGEPHILDVVVPALDAEEEPALRVDSHMHIEVQSSLTGPPIERLDEDEGKALPLIVPTNVHVEEPSFGALPTEDNPVSLSPEPTKEPLPKPPTPKTRAAPPLLLELSPVEGAEIASACLVSPPVPSQAQLIFPTIEDSKTDTPNPKVSLLADLARVRHRYDDLQKAFRDCNLALKELKKNITTSLPSTHPLYQVIQAAVERLDDFNEDARVELEIRVADEERISAGYETLLSVPGAISNSDEVNESEVEVEIKAFIDGSDKGVVKAKERFGKQLEDLQHDIASVKHAMHESPSEVTSPTPTPTLSPASTLSPLYPAHPPVSAPLTKTTGWSSWAGGLLGSPRTAQPVSAARTFGSVMTSPRLRHASFSHLTPNSTSIANGRNTHEECIPNTPNPFASLGLRISMPSHLLTNHSISSTTIYPETSTVSLKPQSSSYSYLSRSPLAGGTGLGGPQKARASSASAMYMLGLGARSGSALPLSSGRSSSGQDLGSSRGSSLGLRSGTGQAFPTMDNGSEDTHKEVEDLNSDIE